VPGRPDALRIGNKTKKEERMPGKSIYDRGEQPGKTIYGNGTGNTDPIIVEGEVVDSKTGADTRARREETAGKTPEERVEEFLRSVASGIKKDKKTEMEQAIARSRRIRRAEQALGNPGKESGITVRHEGMLRRANPQDSARYEASKASHDHGVLLYEVMLYLAKVIYAGKKIGMELHEALIQLDDEYSEAAVPCGELMTEWGMEKYLDTFKEAVDMFPDMRLEDTAQAMLVRPYIWRS
jgi:hypothetical protein